MKPLAPQPFATADDSRYACFESGVDACVVGYGPTLERSFERAAEAMFALATDLDKVHPVRTLPVSFIEPSESKALLRWLNLLIALSRRHRLALCEFHLQREGNRWWGCASGQSRAALPVQAVEMKRARADRISVKRAASRCEARCIVEYESRAGAELT